MLNGWCAVKKKIAARCFPGGCNAADETNLRYSIMQIVWQAKKEPSDWAVPFQTALLLDKEHFLNCKRIQLRKTDSLSIIHNSRRENVC